MHANALAYALAVSSAEQQIELGRHQASWIYVSKCFTGGRSMQSNASREVRDRYLMMCVGIVCGVFSGALHAQVASAQSPADQPPSGDIMEIVVTARKRSEREIDVPAAISVVGAEALARYSDADISSVGDQIPQVMFSKNPSGNGAN